MAETNPFVRKLEYGAKLTDADRQFLASITKKPKRLPARSDISREGETPRDAHLVMKGFACRYKQRENGKRQVMALFVPGDLCDFHVQILGQMDHSIGTITAASVVTVPPETIAEMTANPRINRAMWWMTLVDEGTLREWLVNIGQRSAAARLAHLFCEVRLRLLSVGLAEEDRFEFPLTQTDLAEAMGLTTVHVNRSLKQLRDRDLIRFEGGRIIFPDYERLSVFADFDPNYLHLRDGSREKSTDMPESPPL
jgi:CRP-like cAMP-binding protein